MRNRLAVLTVTAFSAMGLFASSAGAAGKVCFDVKVTANGTEVVNQAGCQELPV